MNNNDYRIFYPNSLIWLNDSMLIVQVEYVDEHNNHRMKEALVNVTEGSSEIVDSSFTQYKSISNISNSVVSPDGNVLWGAHDEDNILARYSFITGQTDLYDIIVKGYLDVSWENGLILAMNDYSLLSLIDLDGGIVAHMQKGDMIDSVNSVSQFNSIRLVTKNNTKIWSINIDYLDTETDILYEGILISNNEMYLDSCQLFRNAQGIFSPNCRYVAYPVKGSNVYSIIIYDSDFIELKEIKI